MTRSRVLAIIVSFPFFARMADLSPGRLVADHFYEMLPRPLAAIPAEVPNFLSHFLSEYHCGGARRRLAYSRQPSGGLC